MNRKKSLFKNKNSLYWTDGRTCRSSGCNVSDALKKISICLFNFNAKKFLKLNSCDVVLIVNFHSFLHLPMCPDFHR